MGEAFQEIPQKLYFRIGEVSDIVGVKPYVLRYWESEFPDIKPSKSKSGQRLYKRRDVEVLLRIRELLYEEKFTINGARKRLKDPRHVDHQESNGAEESGMAVEAKEEKVLSPEICPSDGAVHVQPAEKPSRTESQTRPGAVPLVESRKVLMKVRKELESMLKVVSREVIAERR